MVRLPEGTTCATCPWLADDWVESARRGDKRCGFRFPAQFPASGAHRGPRIDNPEQNGCSLHPYALHWAAIEAGRIRFQGPPAPEPPAEPAPRRRAIRDR